MSSVSLTTAQEMLTLYLEAERKILANQSYTIKDRTFTRADLSAVALERRRWQSVVDSLNNGGSIRVRQVLPRDL